MKKKKTLWGLAGYAALISILLVSACVVYWNLPFTYGVGDLQISLLAKLKDLVSPPDPDNDVVLVDVAYDKVVVPNYEIRDGSAFRSGDKVIVDRGELASFLSYLKEIDNYKYVVCDISINARYQTDHDEELFSTISSMRDVVVAASDSIPEQLVSKAVFAGYEVMKGGDDYMKYSCMIDGRENIALRMWKDITGGTYEEKSWGISMNGKRCLNSFVPYTRFAVYDTISDEGYENNSGVNRYDGVINNLGKIVDEVSVNYLKSDMFKDKIILIGSWREEDQHDTVVGSQSGLSIIYNAYLALVNGDNHLPFFIYLILFLLFWVESVFLLRKIYRTQIRSLVFSRYGFVAWTGRVMTSGIKCRNAALNLLLSVVLYFFSYSFPIFIVAAVIYVSNELFVNAFIIGLVFSFLDSLLGEVMAIDYKKIDRRRKKKMKDKRNTAKKNWAKGLA